MNETSRTTYILRNAHTSLLFSVVALLLGFFSRRIFIDSIGIEVMGLNATVGNLLGLLNLAELGIGSAVSFTLYAPLFKHDYDTINEIVAIQGWLYRRVGYLLLAGSAVLMCFFPWIFAKTDLPLWYAYTTFGVFLLSVVLGYFINYGQIMLSASQQEYKIITNVQSFRIIKQLLQIVGLGLLGLGYVYWLIIELTLSVALCLVLNRTIKKSFPWLHPVLSQGKQLVTKYPQILQKTKQLFFHKMAGYMLTQTSPLIIYILLSLTVVAIYSNYMLLITTVTTLISSIFAGIIAGIGSLIAEGDKNKIVAFFREYTIIRYWLASVGCFCLYYLMQPFIVLWLGKEYLLDSTSHSLLILLAFTTLSRANDSFYMAYGIYHDIYAPITEAVLNLGLSLIGLLLGATRSHFRGTNQCICFSMVLAILFFVYKMFENTYARIYLFNR